MGTDIVLQIVSKSTQPHFLPMCGSYRITTKILISNGKYWKELNLLTLSQENAIYALKRKTISFFSQSQQVLMSDPNYSAPAGTD